LLRKGNRYASFHRLQLKEQPPGRSSMGQDETGSLQVIDSS
jgi:hypothetical protein